MNLLALSEHVFHVAALVFVAALVGFLIVVAVREQLERRRAARRARVEYVPTEVVRRFMEERQLPTERRGR